MKENISQGMVQNKKTPKLVIVRQSQKFSYYYIFVYLDKSSLCLDIKYIRNLNLQLNYSHQLVCLEVYNKITSLD